MTNINKDNKVVLNFESWGKAQNNILFITGLSLSGKTTLAKEYERKYKAIRITLDAFNTKWHEECPMVDKYRQTNSCLTNEMIDADGLIGDEFLKFLDFTINQAKKDKDNLYIIEGLHIYLLKDYMLTKYSLFSEPFIILNLTLEDAFVRVKQRAMEDESLNELLKSDNNVLRNTIEKFEEYPKLVRDLYLKMKRI